MQKLIALILLALVGCNDEIRTTQPTLEETLNKDPKVFAFPPGGDYATDLLFVALVVDPAIYSVVFTLDGTDPNPLSLQYGFTLFIAYDVTLKYALVYPDGTLGEIKTEKYNIWDPPEAAQYTRVLMPEAWGYLLTSPGVGQTVTREIALDNIGENAITISSIKFDTECGAGCPFGLVVGEDFPYTLAPGQRGTMGISYCPVGTGFETVTLVVASDAENYPLLPIQFAGTVD